MAPGHKTALLALARTELAEADPTEYRKTLDRVIRCVSSLSFSFGPPS